MLASKMIFSFCSAWRKIQKGSLPWRTASIESDCLENQWFATIRFVVGREAQPECRGLSVIRRHAETNGMIRNATFARGSMTGVRGKNPMRVFWLGYARHMHGDLRAINGLLPTDLWSLQGHMRVFRRVERDKMSLIHGVLGALEPVAIFRAGADGALAALFEKQIVARQ